MNITSLLFLFLSFVAALIYQRLPSKYRNFWLLLLSVAFLTTWSWQFVIVLILFGLVNFGLGIRLNSPDSKKRAWLAFGILLNLAVLFVFKYSSFYLPAFTSLLAKMGVESSDGLKILLPVGLSFLVVQAISYLVDVSNGRLAAERNLINFGIYILYFPKLLSGPVERVRSFIPRLENPKPLDREALEKSLSLILVGLFRKLFFADALFRMIPDAAFRTPQQYAGQHLVFWLLAYAFALYNDFAGYSSIVRGVSLWFGIELTNNFNLPYLSHNFTEFWTRWHISLSNWLRDYIFFPLSRTLMRQAKTSNSILVLAVPPLATLLASGMWHGLSWNLLVWGGLHGFYLFGERLVGLVKRPVPLQEQSKFQRAFGLVITFIFAVLTWIPFRMSLPVALQYLTAMFKWVMPDRYLILAYIKGTTTVESWSPLNLPNPLLLMVLLLAIGFDLLMNKNGSEREFRSFRRGGQILLAVLMLLLIFASLFADTAAPFVYQGF